MTAPPMDDLISLQHELHELEQDSQRGPRIVADLYKSWKDAKREYDVAKARAYLKAKGSTEKRTVPEIEAYVELDTIVERERAEVAEAAHRYAASRVDELSDRRSSLQTRSKLLLEQMRLSGTGGQP